MKITCIDDIKKASDKMHDSEFKENDFGFDNEKKRFFLRSHSVENQRKAFYLEIFNVEEYNPINLEKIKRGKATGGVFNNIKVKNNKLELIIQSQDLRIKLKLNKIEGKFEEK